MSCPQTDQHQTNNNIFPEQIRVNLDRAGLSRLISVKKMTSVKKTVWKENSPETLFTLATRLCLHHKEVFTNKLPCGSYQLRPGLYLPVEICESLFQICEEENYGRNVDDNFTNIFGDSQNTRLGEVSLDGSGLSDQGMRCLLGHALRKISINNCDQLTTRSLENINENSDNLICLNVEKAYKIFPDFLSAKLDTGPWEDEYDEDDFDSVEESESVYEKRHYILRAPRLKVLCLKDLYIVQGKNYFNILCKALPNLSVLDLSGLAHSQGLQKLKFLLNCPHLVSLVLHNVKEVKYSLSTLQELTKLEHLDISQVRTPDHDTMFGCLSSLEQVNSVLLLTVSYFSG